MYLAEWCAAQPDRGGHEKIEELARMAGCSTTTITQVIRGERRLSVPCARDLVRQLGLPADQAAHLLELFELQHAPPRTAQARRQAVLDTVSGVSGAGSGASNALLEDERSDECVVAALAPALAALEGDRPALRTLLRSAVPAMALHHLSAAAQAPSTHRRLGPRFVELAPPSEGRAAALAHHGALSFAADGLLRLRAAERDFRCFCASLDEEGFAALDEPCRNHVEAQRALSEDAEARLPRAVLLHQIQRLVAAGPVPQGASSGEVRWRRPAVELPLLGDPAPTLGRPPAGRPHPAGVTWFPTWVALWRAWAEQAGQPCSDAWLAERTGLPRSTVYDLCMGTMRFTSRHVFGFLEAMGLSGDRSAQIALEGMAMVAMGSGDLHLQATLLPALREMGLRRGARHAEAEAHHVQSNWHARVVYNLPDLPGFQPLAGWICRAMKGRVDWGASQQALDALLGLGVLRRDADGRTVVVEPEVLLEGPHSAAAQYALYRGLLGLCRVELDRRDPDLTLNTYMVALPDQAMPRLQRLSEAWDRAVFAVLRAAQERRRRGAPMDRVVLISRQRLPLFRLPAAKRAPPRARPHGPTADGA